MSLASRNPHFDKCKELNNQGLAQAQAGFLDEAIALYNQALAAYPESQVVRANRACALFETGRYDEALVDLDEAVALDPADWHALNMRAVVRMRLGDLPGAVEDTSHVIANLPHPGEPQVHFRQIPQIRYGE